jgi:hypothetical protein
MGADGMLRTVVTVQREDGLRIRGLLLEPADAPAAKGLMLIAPGLGRTIRHSTVLALQFARHGYASLRFDLTNHTGDSDGDIFDATLSSAAEDLLCIAEAVRANGWDDPVFPVASSLGARAAIRAASRGMLADGLVLILPVVDFAKTVASVTGEDLVAAHLAGRIDRKDRVQVLTHGMSGVFLADAVEAGMCDIVSVQRELAVAGMPVAAVAAENDAWVQLADVVAAIGAESPMRQVFVLESADHDSYSFGFIRALTQTAVRAVANMTDEELDDVHHIGFSELVRSLKIEKDVLKRARARWRSSDG